MGAALPKPPAFSDPPTFGYLHFAADVWGTRGRTPFPRSGERKAALFVELKRLALALEALDAVSLVSVYRARLIPPLGRSAQLPAPPTARYDVCVLVQTVDVSALDAVRVTPECERLRTALRGAVSDNAAAASGDRFLEMPAECLRAVADVDRSRPGLFLFNYFLAEHPDEALRCWERLVAWYVTNTGLDNSTLLASTEPCPYVFVNHARWDCSLPRFAVRQFTRPSFRLQVVVDLRAHGIVSMPIFYSIV